MKGCTIKLLIQSGNQRNVNSPQPNTDALRGKVEGINQQQTALWQLGAIAQALPLEVQVLSKLCLGEEVCARCLVLIHQTASVRAEFKLLSVAALCSHNFKIRTACQPLTYS